VFLGHGDLPGNRDGVEQLAHLPGLHNRRDTHSTAEFRALDEHRGVFGNDLLDDEPVEQTAQRGQVLLDGGRGQRLAFDIGGDVQRPDGRQPEIMVLTPAAELGDGLNIGRARVFVADRRGGEEFEEILAGFVAGARDDGGHGKFPGAGGQERGGYQLSCHAWRLRQWIEREPRHRKILSVIGHQRQRLGKAHGRDDHVREQKSLSLARPFLQQMAREP
jgi:hypothetical protein